MGPCVAGEGTRSGRGGEFRSQTSVVTRALWGLEPTAEHVPRLEKLAAAQGRQKIWIFYEIYQFLIFEN